MKLWTFSKCKDCGKEFKRGVLFESKLDGNIAICPDCVELASKMLSLDYAALRERLAAAEKALEPFADAYDFIVASYPDIADNARFAFVNQYGGISDIGSVGDLRRAAALLQPAAARE